MQEVEKIAIQKAIRTLNAVKDHVQYAIEFDGVTYGNRELAAVKSFKRPPRYPHGATRKHYLPYLESIKDGGVVSIPFGGFDGSVLSANISAACVHLFGKGNATVHKNPIKSCIEVLIVSDTSKKQADLTLSDIWGDDEDEA